MIFVGDPHGKKNRLRQIVKNADDESKHTCFVGDIGMFRSSDRFYWVNFDPMKHRFIRGNHDNPSVCKAQNNYLGDFGYDEHTGIFWAGGGHSIDKQYRIEGRDWWSNEELSYRQAVEAYKLYIKVKPRIVVTHEIHEPGKYEVCTSIFNEQHRSTNEVIFTQMWEYEDWKPEFWVFGHFHRKKIFTISPHRTIHVCLDELINGSDEDVVFEIPGLSWSTD